MFQFIMEAQLLITCVFLAPSFNLSNSQFPLLLTKELDHMTSQFPISSKISIILMMKEEMRRTYSSSRAGQLL